MNQERLLRMGAVAGIVFLLLLGFAWIALAHDATQNQLSWLQGFVALASFLGAAASFGSLLLAITIAAALVGGVAYVANTDYSKKDRKTRVGHVTIIATAFISMLIIGFDWVSLPTKTGWILMLFFGLFVGALIAIDAIYERLWRD